MGPFIFLVHIFFWISFSCFLCFICFFELIQFVWHKKWSGLVPIHFVTMMDHHWGGSWGGGEHIYIYIYKRSTNQSTMINVESTWTSSQKPIARGSFSVYWNLNLGHPNANPSENQVQFQSNVKTTASLLLKAYCYLEGARLHSKFPLKNLFL